MEVSILHVLGTAGTTNPMHLSGTLAGQYRILEVSVVGALLSEFQHLGEPLFCKWYIPDPLRVNPDEDGYFEAVIFLGCTYMCIDEGENTTNLEPIWEWVTEVLAVIQEPLNMAHIVGIAALAPQEIVDPPPALAGE